MATVRLGISTQTYDREGSITNITKPEKIPSAAEIKGALEEFEGAIEQIPPLYSALKYKGKRLYQMAREGIAPSVIPARKVHIFRIELKDYSYPFIQFNILCGRGTYIRSMNF